MIDTFKRLVDRLDSDRVIWRFDPMVLTDRISKDDLLENLPHLILIRIDSYNANIHIFQHHSKSF